MHVMPCQSCGNDPEFRGVPKVQGYPDRSPQPWEWSVRCSVCKPRLLDHTLYWDTLGEAISHWNAVCEIIVAGRKQGQPVEEVEEEFRLDQLAIIEDAIAMQEMEGDT